MRDLQGKIPYMDGHTLCLLCLGEEYDAMFESHSMGKVCPALFLTIIQG